MSPQISQSVGTSQTLARQRGHMKPSLLRSEWQAQRLGGDASGRRVGNPIIIRSAAGFVVPAPVARDTARCAGGGTDSNKRSLKWPSFIATPNRPTLPDEGLEFEERAWITHRQFCHTDPGIFSSLLLARPRIFGFYS